ncbi:hypothetical protein FB107DRAFT_279559 [Schizophyllum commune]
MWRGDLHREVSFQTPPYPSPHIALTKDTQTESPSPAAQSPPTASSSASSTGPDRAARTGADPDDEEWRRAEWERQWGLKARVEARARREATRMMVEARERAMQARRTPPGEGVGVGVAGQEDAQRMQQEDKQRTPTQQVYPPTQQRPQPTWQATVDQSLALTHEFKQALFSLPQDVRENYLRSLPPHESLVLQKQLWDIPENWVPAGQLPPMTQHQEQGVEVPFRTQVQEPQQQQDQVMRSPPRARPPPQAQPRPLQDLATLTDPRLQQLQAQSLQQQAAPPPPQQLHIPPLLQQQHAPPSQPPAPDQRLEPTVQQPSPSAQQHAS